MKSSKLQCHFETQCSNQVPLQIAQKKQPYTLEEDLIKPSAIDICNTMYGNDIDFNKLKTIQVVRLADVFALQLDEPTNV